MLTGESKIIEREDDGRADTWSLFVELPRGGLVHAPTHNYAASLPAGRHHILKGLTERQARRAFKLARVSA